MTGRSPLTRGPYLSALGAQFCDCLPRNLGLARQLASRLRALIPGTAHAQHPAQTLLSIQGLKALALILLLTTVHYCPLLLTTAHYCSLLLTTVHYCPLPLTTVHYRSLPLTTANYCTLLLTTAHYCPLLLNTVHYYSLLSTTAHSPIDLVI